MDRLWAVGFGSDLLACQCRPPVIVSCVPRSVVSGEVAEEVVQRQGQDP